MAQARIKLPRRKLQGKEAEYEGINNMSFRTVFLIMEALAVFCSQYQNKTGIFYIFYILASITYPR